MNRGGRGGVDLLGSHGSGSGRGSEVLSWRKLEFEKHNSLGREESEASSPLKLPDGTTY